LIEILKAQIPQSWSFIAWSLPKIGQSDSKKEFKKAVGEIVIELPSPVGNAPIYIKKVISSGNIFLEIIPKEIDASWLAGPRSTVVSSRRLSRLGPPTG
jgi:hypothetical protein